MQFKQMPSKKWLITVIALALMTGYSSISQANDHPNHHKQHKKSNKLAKVVTVSTIAAMPLASLSAGADITRLQALLEQNNFEQAKLLLPQLTAGDLSEYAQYLWLNANPNMRDFPSFIEYVQHYPNTGWTDRLKQTWSEYLAKQKQWQALNHYAGLFNRGDAQCWAWQSYINIGTELTEDWYTAVKQQWKTQLKPNQVCQVVHQQLIQAHQLSADDWQQKVYFALSQTKFKRSQIEDWLETMPEDQRRETKQLLTALAHPETMSVPNESDSKQLHRYLVFLRQLALSDPQLAYQHWQALTQKITLHPLIQASFERHLFWQLSKKDKDNAITWLQKIPASQHDEMTLTPILNQAWKTNDWSLLLSTLTYLPVENQQQDRWQYWQAKALQQLGRKEEAQYIWQQLAQQRSFYGFLAADLLDKPYQLNTLSVNSDALLRVKKDPFLAQLKALYHSNLKDVAWREWRYRISSGAVALADVPAFAQMALDWGWTEFSVLSMGNPQHWDYVHLRFPMPYRSLLAANSQQYQIPLAWAYAITRRESAYNAGVTSHSGAIGLMQLMPQTAKMVAKELGTSIKHKHEIYQPELNVQLGTKHLSQLINQFDQNYLLATAAYNAGAARVKQWLKQNPDLATDQWVELIPFKETRDYVKAVLEYWLVFERLGGLPQTQLASYTSTLPKAKEKEAQNAEIVVTNGLVDSNHTTSEIEAEKQSTTPQSEGIFSLFNFF